MPTDERLMYGTLWFQYTKISNLNTHMYMLDKTANGSYWDIFMPDLLIKRFNRFDPDLDKSIRGPLSYSTNLNRFGLATPHLDFYSTIIWGRI